MRVLFDQLRIRVTRDHVIRFAISLVLATMLWGWVTDRQDPIETEQFESVAIEIPPLPETLQVVNELEPVTVRITGPRSVLREVVPREVGASLDVSGINGAGSHRVPVNAEVPDEVREVDTSPREVQIQVEATASRNFSLTQQLPTATDDSRTVTSVTPEVSEVTVTGPESAVNRVDRVLLPIELGENTDDFTAGFAPVAVDARNQPISEVQILPERVSAFVAVQTRGKSVSVVPQTSGAPTEGYSVIQRTVMPQTVVVDGPAELLEDLLFVETEPVNIEGRTESLVQQAPITGLPEGVTVVDPATSQVEVTVVIQEAAVEQGLPNQPVETIGLNPRYTARVEPETVTVVLDAPRDLLRAMNADDVKVRVDLSGRGPGTYELRPDVTVPPGVTWNGNEPQTVRVVIEHAPAGGTPLPIATPD